MSKKKSKNKNNLYDNKKQSSEQTTSLENNSDIIIEFDLKAFINNHQTWFAIFVFTILGLIIFSQATNYGFVWDDNRYHLHPNPYFQKITLDNMLKLWSNIYVGMYIPFAYTIWGFLKPIGMFFSGEDGYNLFTYHFANIVIHITNTFLIFHIVKKIIKNYYAALIGTLIFLVHPIQVESVVWISELRGILAVMMGLISFVFYLKRLEEAPTTNLRHKYFIYSLVAFLLGLLSKPSIVIIPLLIFIYEVFILNIKLKKSAINILPWLLIAIPIILVTRSAQPYSSSHMIYPYLERPFIWMDTINFYLYNILYPFDLGCFYARRPNDVTLKWFFYLSWIIPLVITTLLWKIRKNHKILLFSFAFFVLAFLPTSGLMPFDFQRWSTVADRYIYLSMAGFSFAMAYILDRFKNKIIWSVSICIILFYTTYSMISQVPIWKDSVTLWNHALTIVPEEPQAYNNRGDGYSKAGKYKTALKDFNVALRINPKYLQAYANKGSVLNNLKRYHEAIDAFSSAIKLQNKYLPAYEKRALVYFNTGQIQKSWEDVLKVRKLGGKVNSKLLNALKQKIKQSKKTN